MDWIDEKFEFIGKWLGNLSLRKALIAYIIMCVVTVVCLYALTVFICEKQEAGIWSRYTTNDELIRQDMIISFQDSSVLTKAERVQVTIIDFIKAWSILLYSISGIIGVSLLFYHKKLKQPLMILKEATKKVAMSNLDIEMFYDSKDEMGDLCRSFDLMRKQLIMNNQKMWDLMEEQKRLNAAFAHDLRTPLTVLRGYTDFLAKYLPQGKISEEKLLLTLSMMSGNIGRLESYSNTMKEIHSFEELPVRQVGVSGKQLVEKVKELIEVFHGMNSILIKLTDNINDEQIRILLDEAIFMEVLENLMSNALRYAKTEIKVIIMISEAEHQLLLSVADDGKGFSSRDLTMAVRPYYTDRAESKSEHYGIGLYICKLLCEKHGGWITLSNGLEGGAVITTAFEINDLKK